MITQKIGASMFANHIYYNGRVITMDPEQPLSTAFKVVGDFFQAVGSDENIRKYRDPETELIDLQGKTVVPGFIETHSHTSDYAINLLEVDCSPAANSSMTQILAR
ncbi:MAG: amidohydrolase family protein, partial [Deltaproteobacteria bacterium]|nr:amidohydrolase family protein [Deltaproteobacteria bacterium]